MSTILVILKNVYNCTNAFARQPHSFPNVDPHLLIIHWYFLNLGRCYGNLQGMHCLPFYGGRSICLRQF